MTRVDRRLAADVPGLPCAVSSEQNAVRADGAESGALVGVIALAYLAKLPIVQMDWGALAHGAVAPGVADRQALLIAAGIIGATAS